MILWRPVGLGEMALIFESSMRAFPPRLPDQPIFYPVLNEDYAVQIARDWNTKERPFAGYVLRFDVTDEFAVRFEPRIVGGSAHREFWVPAGELAEFNSHIREPIVVERAFFGPDFRGHIPEGFGLIGMDAYAQVAAMLATLDYAPMDFTMEISANAPTFFLNYPFWRAAGSARLGVEAVALDRCLERMRGTWDLSPRPAPFVEDAAMAG